MGYTEETGVTIMKIVVIGGTGLIGSKLVPKLRDQDTRGRASLNRVSTLSPARDWPKR